VVDVPFPGVHSSRISMSNVRKSHVCYRQAESAKGI